MTTEEMFQLLLNKVDTNHTEVKAEIARLEAKLDGAITDIKELKTDVSEIKADVHLLKNSTT